MKLFKKENKRIAMKLDTAYIMKNVEIPISIVECGFLSNPEEEKNDYRMMPIKIDLLGEYIMA